MRRSQRLLHGAASFRTATDGFVTTAEPDLRRIALQLAKILGPDSSVLVGALAVAVHGYPRATDDVDLLTRLDLKEAQKRLRAQGIDSKMKRGDPLEGDFSCLQGSLQGVRFDILPELVPIQWGRVLRLSVGGGDLNVVDLPDLIRLKLRAGGPQDLMDAAHLLLQHPEHLAKAREAARTYRLEDKLEIWLKDSRVRSKVQEEIARRQKP
jgi:hypothetical protein